MNTLNIGERITQLRRAKKWSQEDLANAIEASRDMIGKYERNDNSPSIEAAFRIADVFDVSLDYLLGKGQHAAYDRETIKRLEDIEKLDKDTREHLFFLIDNVIQNYKTKQAFA